METARLKNVLDQWIGRWERDHPDLATGLSGKQGQGSSGRRNELGQLNGNEAVGAVAILHERTRLLDRDAETGEPGVGVSKQSIRSVVVSRWRTTELRTADLLVAAAECPEVFHDGSLAVIPNPRASADAQRACCGGSLNGSGEMH